MSCVCINIARLDVDENGRGRIVFALLESQVRICFRRTRLLDANENVELHRRRAEDLVEI